VEQAICGLLVTDVWKAAGRKNELPVALNEIGPIFQPTIENIATSPETKVAKKKNNRHFC
jgi:hypothetical protein